MRSFRSVFVGICNISRQRQLHRGGRRSRDELIDRYYPVTEFIIYPKKGTKSKSRGQDKGKDKRDASSAITSTLSHAESKLSTSPGLPAPTLGEMDITPSTTSSVGDSGIATPLTKPDSRPGSPADKDASGLVPIQDLEEAKRAALRQRPPRADGGVVACVAVWEYCFKIGRLTVPPVSFVIPLGVDGIRAGLVGGRGAVGG